MLDYGLGGVGATLAARSLDAIDRVVVIVNGATAGVASAWILPLDTDPDDSYFSFGFGTGGLNFPYGINVEPDGPV